MNFRLSLPARLAALVLAVTAAGCGPGVGGTGTGEEALPAAGASTAALCEADFAPLLRCAAAVGMAAQGTALVYAADSEPQSRYLARLEGQSIELELRCTRQRFSGTWAADAASGARFLGELRADIAGVPGRPASLQVQRDGAALVLRLFDESGALIGSAFELRPAAGPTAPAPC
jgi:hypothetical protein